MKHSFKLASILLLLASAAHAQQANYQGTWTGMATSATGAQVRVVLTIEAGRGTLRMSPSANYVTIDQCHDRDIPVAVESQTDAGLKVDIKGEQVLHGCINESATLKWVSPKVLEGTLKDGRTMKLERK